MADIDNNLEQIRTAIYGKDVRESIASGIEAINIEVENTTEKQEDLESTFDQLIINAGSSNAEIVDARVNTKTNTTYLKLKDRLDDEHEDLSNKMGILNELQTTDKDNLVNAINENVVQLNENAQQINNNKSKITMLDQLKLQIVYNAIGDGISDDTIPIQRYIDDIQSQGGGIVCIPYGKIYKISQLNITAPNITIIGGGTLLDGSLKIGQTNGTPLDLFYNIDGIKFKYTSKTTGKHGITLINARKGRIYNCDFINCDACIYVEPLDYTQHCSRCMISNNIFRNSNYCLYIDRILNATNIFCAGDFHFINNQGYEGIGICHVLAEGIDGIVIEGNTLFFPNYADAVKSTTKEHNIKIVFGDWITINGNNLFEAGLDSIYIQYAKDININGNNIAWCGQRELSNGITILNGDVTNQPDNRVIITANNIILPSKHGIHLAVSNSNGVGYVLVDGNNVREAGSSTCYYGTTDINSVTHYGIMVDTNVIKSSVVNNMCFDNKCNISNASYFANNVELDNVIREFSRTLTVSTAATTINTTGYQHINLNMPSAVTITSLTQDSIFNKQITLFAFNGNTTIQNNSTIKLKGGANATMPTNSTLTLKYASGTWWEIARSF